jgi:hypothetical protein
VIRRLGCVFVLVVLLAGCARSGSQPGSTAAGGSPLFSRTTAAGVRIDTRSGRQSCVEAVHVALAYQGRTRAMEAVAKDSQLRAKLQVVTTSVDALVVHVVSSAIATVRWAYGAGEDDAMKPVKGWAVLAKPLQPSEPRPDDTLQGGTQLVGVDKHGATLATIAVVSTPPALGVIRCP